MFLEEKSGLLEQKLVYPNFYILCGGKGSRLEGISSVERPKPFVSLENGKTLLQLTIERISKCSPGSISLVADLQFESLIESEVIKGQDGTVSVFYEDQPSGTTRAIFNFVQKSTSSINCILPCDQVFDSPDHFKEAIEKACKLAKQTGSLVLIGVQPTDADNQLGYFLPNTEGRVLQFCEKPNLEYSRKLISAGWLVNTCIFVGSGDWFLKNVSKQALDACGSFERDVVAMSQDVRFIKADFRFVDVGTVQNFTRVFGSPSKWKSESDESAAICFEKKQNDFWSNKESVDATPHEFDDYVQDYRSKQDGYLWLSGESSFYFAEYKARKAAEWLPELASTAIDVLDFGCGDGVMTDQLSRFFGKARLSGCDVSATSVDQARIDFPKYPFFYLDEKAGLATDSQYDLIVAAGVFHHISFDEHEFWIKNIKNALRPNGIFLMFELNPLNPGTQIIFRRNPMEANAKMLWPDYAKSILRKYFGGSQTRFCSFFPRMFKFMRSIEPFLEKLPFGALYASLCKKT